MHRKLIVGLHWSVLIILGVLASPSAALTTSWNTDASGDFGGPNWDNGVPGSSDTAQFNRPGDPTFTVTFRAFPPIFSGHYSTHRLILRSGDVSFVNTFGADYTLLNPSLDDSLDRGIIVGLGNGDVTALTTFMPISAPAATIADGTGSFGAVRVNSGMWRLTGSDGAHINQLIVGRSGFGTLAISNGAAVELTGDINGIFVGENSGAVGAILVSGAGSQLKCASDRVVGLMNTILVGGLGTGTLTITAGGQVFDDGAALGDAPGGIGDVSVDGVGSLWSNRSAVEIFRGTLTVFNGGTVEADNVGIEGTLRGNGTVKILNGIVFNQGITAPGFPFGTLSVKGLFRQGSFGHLQIQLDGTTAAQYDQLQATSLELDGALDVSLMNPFSPNAGDAFHILDSTNSISGTFSSVNLPMLSAGLMWNTSRLYTAGDISVQIIGDYNGNGTVDAADFTVWQDSLGRTGAGLAADGNLNGAIDNGDFGTWKSRFGQHPGSGGNSSGPDAAPEPATIELEEMSLLAIFVCHVFLCRNVRASQMNP